MWAYYSNDLINLGIAFGLHKASRQILKYSDLLLWQVHGVVSGSFLCVIGEQYMVFYISEMKYNAKANLRWQSRAEIFKPIDCCYEECLFFFVYKKVTEVICYACVTHRVSSKLCASLYTSYVSSLALCVGAIHVFNINYFRWWDFSLISLVFLTESSRMLVSEAHWVAVLFPSCFCK